MDSRRTFHVYDSSLSVRNPRARSARFEERLPDRELHSKLLRLLRRLGFKTGPDTTGTSWQYPSLRKNHRLARRGDLQCAIEIYPTGSQFEFFQDVVVENASGGRYDFHRVARMPYLIRKSFERALSAMTNYLLAQGFLDRSKVLSPVTDPLRAFNETWDSEWDWASGTHRFKRDAAGWPTVDAIGHQNCVDRDGTILTHGALRYARDRKGYLIRGRVYGGINGNWTFICGPGKHDYTVVYRDELFTCRPSEVPRKQYSRPDIGLTAAAKAVRRKMAEALASEDFEAAVVLRDRARHLEGYIRAA